MPTLLFLALDAYYLALERGFRNSYNRFIDRLHGSILQASDMYVMAPEDSQPKLLLKALTSFSIWPFYAVLLVMIYLAKVFVI